MTFSEAKKIQASIEAEVAALSARLCEFPTGPMGMTPDAVKFSPEFRATKQFFNAAFARLRSFNATFLKAFKKEMAEERAVRTALNARMTQDSKGTN